MKKKVSALVVALGVATTPIVAKQVNKRQARTESSNDKTMKNRIANTFKRLNLKKAEKEFLKETEEDIQSALSYTNNQDNKSIRI